MPSRPFSCLLMLIALLCAAVPAQEHKKKEVDMRFLSPDKFERETKADADGLLQWVEFKPQQCAVCKGTKVTTCMLCFRQETSEGCPECAGKGEAACRSCGGLGAWPDPLLLVHCPECQGAGCLPCMMCGSSQRLGKIKITGGGDSWQNCPSCRGDGGIACAVCGGKRLVEAAVLKPSLQDASVQALQKAKAAVDAVTTAVSAYEPMGNQSRKWVKEFNALFTPPAMAVLPPLKKLPKALEDAMKKVQGSSQYVGFDEREQQVLKIFKNNAEYYLKYQNRLLTLCLARAEANAKVLAEKKAAEKKGN